MPYRRAAPPKVIKAKYAGTCAETGAAIQPGATILYDVKCSRRLGEVIREAGGEPEMWRSGHSFIKARMEETGALLGGEMTGHLFFGEHWFGFDDAIYAAAHLLEILLATERTPEEVFAGLPHGVATPELHIPLAEERHGPVLEALLARARFEGAELTLIDGLRVDYPDRWGLVRPSNTSPNLVLRFEGDDQHALDAIKNEFRTLLLGVDPSLRIPF